MIGQVCKVEGVGRTRQGAAAVREGVPAKLLQGVERGQGQSGGGHASAESLTRNPHTHIPEHGQMVAMLQHLVLLASSPILHWSHR